MFKNTNEACSIAAHSVRDNFVGNDVAKIAKGHAHGTIQEFWFLL